MSTSVVPGQIIGSISSHTPGPGTHVYENNILASISGSVINTPAPTVTANKIDTSRKPSISIQTRESTSKTHKNSNPLPTVGSTVLCRITRVQQRQLNASILVVINPSSQPSSSQMTLYTSLTNDDQQFQALLRKEDIRMHEKDKIVANDMYRVGDVVRATVISLGSERNYYISTAGDEYGVLVAKSEAGNAMVPASWKEMKDVVTGRGERRKVAKPV